MAKKQVCLRWLAWMGVMLYLLFARKMQVYAVEVSCTEAIVVSSDMTIEDETIDKDVYVLRDATLTLSGSTTFNGNIYVTGTLVNNGTWTFTQTVYCLNYGTNVRAGNYDDGFYDYGFVLNYGYVTGHSLVAKDAFLSTMPTGVVHSWVTETVNEPTCTQSGTARVYCQDCGYVQDEAAVLPATGHSVVTDTTGSRCSVCGAEKSVPLTAQGAATAVEYTTDKEDSAYIDDMAPALPEASTKITGTITPNNPVTLDTVDRKIRALKGNKDLKGSSYYPLRAGAYPWSDTVAKFFWQDPVYGCKYIVYGAKCGSGKKFKRLKTSDGYSCKIKNLKKGTYYKFIVAAVYDGEVVAVSRTIYVAMQGGKVTNPKQVTVKKGIVSLKPGKQYKINASVVLPSSKKVKQYRALSYESADTSIVKVTKKGVIKAMSKGTCYVYAYAQNGKSAQIKVKVR